jgi:signal transduction histidine kinase/ligand-binding sensor domain-containing protein/DNA-binding response OmpR family regulator
MADLISPSPYHTERTLIQRCVFLTFCFWSITLSSFGQGDAYREFENVFLGNDASIVNCLIQDQQGLMWMGSDKGLFSYNGYSVQQHLFSLQKSRSVINSMIHCGLFVDAIHLYLGSESGLLVYNIETDSFEKPLFDLQVDIRSMVVFEGDLWIGTLNGLYRYSFKKRSLEDVTKRDNFVIPNKVIYVLLKSQSDVLYVGTYNGLCYLDTRTGASRQIALPVVSLKNNLLVNSLLEDPIHKCVWVGTEGYLFEFIPATRSIKRVSAFDGNSIKSMALDHDNNLLLGTDNGLYVYNQEKKNIKHVVHDSRDNKSLTNNIIWTIFTDRQMNVWFGTDYGVSCFNYNKAYRDVPISQLTGVGDGNQLQAIFKDSHNNFWYGGTNGLIYTSADGKTCLWYKMGDARYSISHNRIRAIYEDRDKNLWVATDGSLNRYNYQTHQFIHYNIVDKTGTRNANWAYSLFEDEQNRLWIATYLGGIFVVNKDKLIQNRSGTYVAEQNYFKGTGARGLSDRFINCILPDLQGNVWALTYNNGINKIDAHTGLVSKFSLKTDSTGSSSANASCMIRDRKGYIWVGFFGGLNRIDPRTNQFQEVQSNRFKDAYVRLLTEENNHIWITTSDGTFVLDKSSLKIRWVNVPDKPFSCSFYNEVQHEVYLGGVDGFIAFSPSIVNNKITNPSLVLTGLYVNDRLYQAGLDYKGNSIRYSKQIELPYNQNNVTFEFSDLNFSEDVGNQYVYQLKGADGTWRTVKSDMNRISYTNLPPGSYRLNIGKVDADGKMILSNIDFLVIIRSPWYATIWAKLFYLLLIVGFLLWSIRYYREKHRLKIERIKKEKSLELSNMKIDFFTNASHELKTPLSLIIGPLGKLLIETKNASLKKQLNAIQQNAFRLNTLIQQVIGFERFDGSSNSMLIPSQVEFIEFAKGIFSVYEEAFRTKHLTSDFVTDEDWVLVNMDVLKMESVLNNLISNAYKFSREGGKITLEIHQSNEKEHQLTISISDTGIGIPAADIPYIFDRFFQSRKTAGDKEGTGIGLSLVKNYVEQHGGTIQVASEEDKGTVVTLLLPIVESQSTESAEQSAGVTGASCPERSDALILIVEDNLEVCNFIVQSLSPWYRCEVAHNGKNGLDKALKLHPDLIIADMMMPVMNGLEMCRQLRKQTEMALVPIIMLTAKDDKMTEEKSMEIGVNAFVAKPFDTNMLLLRIKQLIGTKQHLNEKVRLDALSAPKEIEAESWEEKFLSNITRIIEEKVADPDLSVNMLSRSSGVSDKQIYRKIKQLTGLTPVDYIRSIRMKKAAMLLTQKKFSVAEVMYLVGFSNYSYFSKCFHAKYGKTPKQFME